MILESLAIANIGLGIFDAWLTQRRMKKYGPQIELNRAVRWMSTLLGPELAAIWGVLGPSVGWSYCLWYFHWQTAMAFLVGYNLKRFFSQVTSIELEKHAEVRKLLQELGSGSATLPEGESTPPPDPFNSKDK